MTIHANHEQEQLVETIVAAYLQAVDNGENPDPVQLIRDNPQFTSELTEFFRACQEVDDLVQPRSADEAGEPPPERLGDFRIGKEISRGGMKIVYEAVQEPLGRRVAVATIRYGRVIPQNRERFLREQRVLAMLHETHIVPIFAAGRDGPIQYFAMPYIDGAALHEIVGTAQEWESAGRGAAMPSLQELAKRVLDKRNDSAAARSPLETETVPRSRTLSREYFRSVARVMADVAQSLHYAHEHEIFHRDLKPANIMVDTDGQSWLIDFGLAGCLLGPDDQHGEGQRGDFDAPLTMTDDMLGTPAYMAPEQKQGVVRDPRVNVWGLGVTLYELS